MYIDDSGNVGIGTSVPTSRLEVEALSGGDGIASYSSGAGIGVYGANRTSGNFGYFGDTNFGVYGFSGSGYAGYFQGDAIVTGTLTVDGLLTGEGLADITGVTAGAGLTGGGTAGDVALAVVFEGTGIAETVARSDHEHDAHYSPLQHFHSGNDIDSGFVPHMYIDQAITRDLEILPLLLSMDGEGSLLDADTLDGQDGASFASSGDVTSLMERVTNLETLAGGAPSSPLATILYKASSVTSPTPYGVSELEKWVRAAQKGGVLHALKYLTEVDTDGSGSVVVGTDLNNEGLAVSGVVLQFLVARGPGGMNEESPWNPGFPLWVDGGVHVTQDGCDAVASLSPGLITLCYSPSQDSFVETVFVSASDDAGNIVYKKAVSGKSEQERRDVMVGIAESNVSEVERWMRAVQSVSDINSSNTRTDVDTDGSGAVVIGTDLSNRYLEIAGMVSQFLVAHGYGGLNEISPWNGQLPLWRDGGVAVSQDACDAVAQAVPGQISLCYDPAQDASIENAFISAVDGQGNIVFSKSVQGETDLERKAEMADAFNEGVAELAGWIKAVQDGSPQHPFSLLTVIDTDRNGAVVRGTDLTNRALSIAGMVTIYVGSHIQPYAAQVSPWDGDLPLWRDGGVTASQDGCDAAGQSGQITICYNPTQADTIEALFVSAMDDHGEVILRESIQGMTYRERLDSLLHTLNSEVPELETWIPAAKKAGTASGTLTEVDTNGDGLVRTGSDLTNNGLAAAGIVSQFIASRFYYDVPGSPFNYNHVLWENGGSVYDQASCNMVAAALPGRVTLCYYLYENETNEAVFVSAADDNGIIVYQNTLTSN